MNYGWSYQPFQFSGLNDATRGYLNNAGDASDPLRNVLSAYIGQLRQSGGPNTFTDWMARNRNFLTSMYESENTSKLAAGGGMGDQLMPLDWLSGTNIWQTFMGQSPRDRGETSQVPFTRFLTR